jgi:hypothetical protein
MKQNKTLASHATPGGSSCNIFVQPHPTQDLFSSVSAAHHSSSLLQAHGLTIETTQRLPPGHSLRTHSVRCDDTGIQTRSKPVLFAVCFLKLTPPATEARHHSNSVMQEAGAAGKQPHKLLDCRTITLPYHPHRHNPLPLPPRRSPGTQKVRHTMRNKEMHNAC